ncbi:uncharacterized protein LOC132940368 [Metopolophium dirhodum]|uniref:uncharacterized protein LOC132940368 n=1 Tax=Metopolophium dirhodum TaxID=44670 RepID=UPI00298F6D45|nr:uncharacterized protein LOC132940368 [Metopolophium dirhodum]
MLAREWRAAALSKVFALPSTKFLHGGKDLFRPLISLVAYKKDTRLAVTNTYQSQLFSETNNYCNTISPQRNEFDTLCFTNKSTVQSSSSSLFSTPIPNEPTKTLKKCKLPKKVVHSCTFDFNQYSLLEAIGHQLCKLSADMNKVKSSVNYVKQDVTSFIQDQPAPNRQPNSNINSEENHLSCFPLKTECINTYYCL